VLNRRIFVYQIEWIIIRNLLKDLSLESGVRGTNE